MTAVRCGVGFRDQLVWRRDWSESPNGWMVHAAFVVFWTVLGVTYLAFGSLFGIGYLVLAAAAAVVARYIFRKGRPQVARGDEEQR